MQDYEDEKGKKTRNFTGSYLIQGSYSNLECGFPCMEANSTVNLVPLGEGIMELRVCENCDFVVPVSILIPFVCAPFSWAVNIMFYNAEF